MTFSRTYWVELVFSIPNHSVSCVLLGNGVGVKAKRSKGGNHFRRPRGAEKRPQRVDTTPTGEVRPQRSQKPCHTRHLSPCVQSHGLCFRRCHHKGVFFVLFVCSVIWRITRIKHVGPCCAPFQFEMRLLGFFSAESLTHLHGEIVMLWFPRATAQ